MVQVKCAAGGGGDGDRIGGERIMSARICLSEGEGFHSGRILDVRTQVGRAAEATCSGDFCYGHIGFLQQFKGVRLSQEGEFGFNCPSERLEHLLLECAQRAIGGFGEGLSVKGFGQMLFSIGNGFGDDRIG